MDNPELANALAAHRAAFDRKHEAEHNYNELESRFTMARGALTDAEANLERVSQALYQAYIADARLAAKRLAAEPAPEPDDAAPDA